MTARAAPLAGARALVCGHGLHRRGRRRAALRARATRRALWDALLRRGRRPAGLAARDTLRLEACFHLYGNDLDGARGPIEAGLGWCCKEDTGLHRLRGRPRGARAPARPRSSSRSRSTGPGIARQGNPVVGGGEVTSGTLLALPRRRDRHGLPARRARAPRAPSSRSTCAARRARAVVEQKPLTAKRSA